MKKKNKFWIGLSLLLAVSFALVINACKGTGVGPDGKDLDANTGGIPGDPYEAVWAIFDSKCKDCHNPTGAGSITGLFLNDKEAAKTLLTGIPSLVNSDLNRVEPGDPANSVLYQKVSGTTAGAQMPLNADPLSTSEIKSISDWITGLTTADIAPCSSSDSLDAGNTRCCDITRRDGGCYKCTAADSSNRADSTCFVCSAAEMLNPVDTLCYVCQDADLRDTNSHCFEPCTPEQQADSTHACYIPPIPPVSFSADIQPSFIKCIVCHNTIFGAGYGATGGDPDGMELDTVTTTTYTSLMKTVSDVNSPLVAPTKRVAPGDTANSLLWWKITRTMEELEAAGKGEIMPQMGEPFTPEEIELIGRWIMEGALNN